MRRTLSLAIAGAALAAAFVPATPASAHCTIVLEDGSCYNTCTLAAAVVATAYGTADDASGGKLPDIPIDCPA